jgi:DNA repair exonuclease SbcCD ATPase subunit
MARSEFADEFADLLEQDAEYHARIQRALIPRELLLLPEAFARFQARVEERFTQVDQEIASVRAEMREGFARVDAEIASVRAEMREGFAQVDARFAQVDTEIASVRAEMREGFAQVDTEIASVRAEMREGFARVDEQFAEVRAELQRQAAEQRRQANDIAKLKGFVLELIFDRRAPAVFGRYWRRVRVVPATEICELAESIQPLTPEEEESLYRADAYVMGVRKSDGREIIGVVEVSWMVDIGDVERAQRRAEVLMQRGLLAVPVVAGGEATQTAEQAAQRGACALLLDGIFKYPSAVS